MGDKSPKSKERGKKQKEAARVADAAKAALKQTSQSPALRAPKEK
jgi:hypothetical protein